MNDIFYILIILIAIPIILGVWATAIMFIIGLGLMLRDKIRENYK